MTYALTFYWLMGILMAVNCLYIIVHGAVSFDRYANFKLDLSNHDKDWQPHLIKAVAALFVLCVLILTTVFIYSNHLIP